jgi:hypothetical protein
MEAVEAWAAPKKRHKVDFALLWATGKPFSGNYGFAPPVSVTIIRLTARSFQTPGLTDFRRRHGSRNGNGHGLVRHVCRQHGVLLLPPRTLSVDALMPAAPPPAARVYPVRHLAQARRVGGPEGLQRRNNRFEL